MWIELAGCSQLSAVGAIGRYQSGCPIRCQSWAQKLITCCQFCALWTFSRGGRPQPSTIGRGAAPRLRVKSHRRVGNMSGSRTHAFETPVEVALYIRTACDDKFGSRAARQTLKLRRFADKHNFRIRSVYCDVAVSGSTAQRPSLQQMMLAAQAGTANFNAVLVTEVSRLARDLVLSVTLIGRLGDVGIEVISTSEKQSERRITHFPSWVEGPPRVMSQHRLSRLLALFNEYQRSRAAEGQEAKRRSDL